MPDEKEELEIMPLYDQVKLDIYYFFRAITDLRQQVLDDRAEGYKPKQLEKYKAKLVGFFGFILTKIRYPRDKKFEKLKGLKEFVANPSNITDENAEEYYELFDELLEKLGITKIGTVSYNTPETAGFEPTVR